MKTILTNRKAKYEYHILQEFDAGIILLGNEVKSLREGNATINDSFIYLKDNEIWIKNLNISRYKSAHPSVKHIENRDKKLLLNRKEINRITRLIDEKGTTAIPLSIFTNNNKLKIKIGVAKGKKLYDKKNTIKERDIKRELSRENINI